MARPATTEPKLTMPPEEADLVREVFGTSRVILEYGSGGTTLIAAEGAGRTVFSVESDKEWLAGMQDWFKAHPPAAELHFIHGDVGKTRPWGYPVNASHFRRWPAYPNGVWDRPDFRQPDVVLIDGRFRLACFLTALFRSTAPVTVLWDDYAERPSYHKVEDLVQPVARIGRMARFDLQPMTIPPERMSWVLSSYLQPL